MRIGLNFLRAMLPLPVGMPPDVGGVAPPHLDKTSAIQWLRSLPAWLARHLAAERERWFIWNVVGFAAGIAEYFAVRSEPSWWLTASIAGIAAGVAFFAARVPYGGLQFFMALVAAGGFGFGVAKLRTANIATPTIHRDMGPLAIEGRIESLAPLASGRARIVIAPTRVGTATAGLPHRLRLSLAGKSAAAVGPGSWVSMVAMLRPSPEPVQPHDYDFARWAYFEGIGGVGFGLGTPKPMVAQWSDSLLDQASVRIERLRLLMSARIRAAIAGPDGAIASALITGETGTIADDDNDAYRSSGLSHVLSISGTHMALVGFGLFWIVRALLALWPRIALTYPIKKWSALLAIAGTTFYLLISGGGAPPVRSYIMLVAMLAGILFDRPALSMRGITLAALAILLFQPESITQAGFQMSFAAVIGLIALAEWQSGHRRADIGPTMLGGIVWQKIRSHVAGMVLTTIVATVATAPFAIYNFDRAAGFSLLSNFLALPVVGIVIMPAAAAGVVLMPFGLETVPLHVMGWGVHIMTAIARMVAALPGANAMAPAWPDAALILIVTGGLWIALWQRSWRWLGLAPIIFGLSLAFTAARPDVLVARDLASAAVRGTGGSLIVIGNRPDDYTSTQWLKRDGDEREPQAARKGAQCDDLGCTAMTWNGLIVALALRPDALADDCRRADIVFSVVPVRGACPNPRLIIDRFDVLRSGAAAVQLGDGEIRVETVAETRGNRPWAGK